MMKKLYEAYILNEGDLVTYFEKKLSERKDENKVISKRSVFHENGKTLTHYVLEAEEGIINPDHEIK